MPSLRRLEVPHGEPERLRRRVLSAGNGPQSDRGSDVAVRRPLDRGADVPVRRPLPGNGPQLDRGSGSAADILAIAVCMSTAAAGGRTAWSCTVVSFINTPTRFHHSWRFSPAYGGSAQQDSVRPGQCKRWAPGRASLGTTPADRGRAKSPVQAVAWAGWPEPRF